MEEQSYYGSNDDGDGSLQHSQSNLVVHSMAVLISSQFPDFADLDISSSSAPPKDAAEALPVRDKQGVPSSPPSELRAKESARGGKAREALSESDKFPEEEHTREELAEMRKQLPSEVAAVLDSIDACFAQMDEFAKMNEKLQVRREIIERIMAARTMKTLNEANTYEERMSKKQVNEECEEFVKFCQELVSSLEAMDGRLNDYEADLVLVMWVIHRRIRKKRVKSDCWIPFCRIVKQW